MSRGTRILGCALLGVGLILASGCASAPPAPLSYAAFKCPTGPIRAEGRRIETKHSRSGPYFINFGFRSAPDIGAYLEKAQADAGADVLKNADVQLNIPIAIDILFFGYQFGSDTVKANQ